MSVKTLVVIIFVGKYCFFVLPVFFMIDYCLFTTTHPDAKRVYIKGIANITEPIN